MLVPQMLPMTFRNLKLQQKKVILILAKEWVIYLFFFLPFLFYYFLINSPKKLQRTPRPKGENAPGEVPEGKRQASRVRENSTVMGSEVPAEGRRGLRAIGALTVCLRKFRRKEIQMTFFFLLFLKKSKQPMLVFKKKTKKNKGGRA